MAEEPTERVRESQLPEDANAQPEDGGEDTSYDSDDAADASQITDAALNSLSDEELEELRDNEPTYEWQASEYVHNHKGQAWYFWFAVAMVVLVGAAALLRYWLEIAAFLVMGIAILIYSKRPPRTLDYVLDQTGITVDGQHMPFSDFRSFGVVANEDWHTIDLESVKRLSPRMEVIFDTEDFDIIVGHLELHLPRVDRDPDLVERVTRLIRF